MAELHPTLIDLQDLTYRAPASAGQDFTLEIKQFQLTAGERVLLLGPSGSGKSTLLNILTGVVRAQSGLVRLLDQDLTKLSGSQADRLRGQHIGLIFQTINLLPYASIAENIALGLAFAPGRRSKLTQSLDAEIASLLRALGLDQALLSRPATQLSVGQQQRVAAARALIGAPSLIIADEPTSALDATNQARFVSLLLASLSPDQGLLMVSHDERLEPHFTRIVRMEELT